jgi:hypothetical protein
MATVSTLATAVVVEFARPVWDFALKTISRRKVLLFIFVHNVLQWLQSSTNCETESMAPRDRTHAPKSRTSAARQDLTVANQLQADAPNRCEFWPFQNKETIRLPPLQVDKVSLSACVGEHDLTASATNNLEQARTSQLYPAKCM